MPVTATVDIELEATEWCWRRRTLIRRVIVRLPVTHASPVELVAARWRQGRALVRARIVGIPDALRIDQLVAPGRGRWRWRRWRWRWRRTRRRRIQNGRRI